MKKKLIAGIITFFISSFSSSYILVKTCSLDTRNTAIILLTIASLFLIAIHITSNVMLNQNILWVVSKALIIPEVIITCFLIVWKPFTALCEIIIIFASALILRYKSKSKCPSYSKVKRMIKYINANILLSSVILIPGICIMLPHITNSNNALITIRSHEISHTNEYCIEPNEWSKMTISQRTKFIENFIEAQAVELGMETIPNVEICYLPSPLYGSYTRENDLIIVNASIVQNYNAIQLVDTLSHELFHRYEHTLVEDYSNDLLSSDDLSDDAIKKIEGYSRDFDNYSPGGITEESYNNYYFQSVEIDSRAYAELTVSKYFNT